MSSKKAAKKKVAPTPEDAGGHPSKSSGLSPSLSKEGELQERLGRRPWYMALLVLGFTVLVASTLLAFDGSISGWEQRIFAEVNSVSLPSWITDRLAKPLSNAVWGMVILIAILLLIPKYRMRAWQYAVAAGSTYSAVFILEHLISRGRPADFNFDLILRATQGGPGFPSGHVAVLTAIMLTLWPYVGWVWRAVLVILVAAEAWSRVYLGVHWPLDVIGGAAVAMTVVATIHLLPAKVLKFFRVKS